MIHLCRRRWASRASRRTNQASGFAAWPVVSTHWSTGTTRVSTASMHAFIAAACSSFSSSSSSSSLLSLSRVCALPRCFGSILALDCYILSKIRRIHEMQICEIKTLQSNFNHPCDQNIIFYRPTQPIARAPNPLVRTPPALCININNNNNIVK